MSRLLLLGWFATSPAHAWEHVGLAWDEADFPVAYWTSDVGGEDCLVDIPEGVCAAETASAYAAWADNTCTRFDGADQGGLAMDTAVELGNGLSQVSFGMEDIEPGVLGVTYFQPSGIAFQREGETYYRIVESDIAINAQGPWLTHADVEAGICTSQYDLQSVLLHEIGHLGGLDHSCQEGDPCADPDLRNATMYWAADTCSAERATPNVDDVAGMEALYGPGGQLECGTSGSDSLLGIAPYTLNCVVAADGAIDDAVWTFGDGTTDTGTAVTHTWTDEGTYTVQAEISGTDPSCGAWDARVERFGYVRVCDKPQAAFEMNHVLGIRYSLRNQTQIDVVGCVTDVKWAIYDGPAIKGEPFAEFDSWEFDYEFPHEGEWTVVLNVGGPAGTTAAKVTVEAIKHSGIGGLGCASDNTAALLFFLPLVGLRRRRLKR